MTLPSTAYRGYAAPTWDTKTIQQLIDYLQVLQAQVNGLDAQYAISPSRYWVDVDNGTGAASIQSIPTGGAAGTTLNVAGNVWSNNGGGFDASTDLYTVPVGGIYLCRAQMRVVDGFGTNCNIALGISQGSNDISGSWVMWNKYVTGSGGRLSLDTQRIFGVPAGGQVRAYAWQDSGVAMTITAAALQCWRMS